MSDKAKPTFAAGGVRGSFPVPAPGCSVFGGDTTSLFVRGTSGAVIADAGSGIRNISGLLDFAEPIYIVLAHAHLDHISGLPSFAPLFEPGRLVTIIARPQVRAAVETMFAPPFFPMRICDAPSAPEWITPPEADAPLRIAGMELRFAPIPHAGGCDAVFFEDKAAGQKLLVACDMELPCDVADASMTALRAMVDKFGAPDSLVIDAMYTESEYSTHAGWGHSSMASALKFGRDIGAGRTFLTHHAPGRTDSELFELAKNLPQNVSFLKQGETHTWAEDLGRKSI